MGSDRTEEFMYTGLLLSVISRAGSIANKKQVFYFMRRTVWNTFLADYTVSVSRPSTPERRVKLSVDQVASVTVLSPGCETL